MVSATDLTHRVSLSRANPGLPAFELARRQGRAGPDAQLRSANIQS